MPARIPASSRGLAFSTFAPLFRAQSVCMQLHLVTSRTTEPAALVVPLLQADDLPARLAELADWIGISRAGLQAGFRGKAGDLQTHYREADGVLQTVYLLGLGNTRQPHQWRQTVRTFFHQQKQQLPARVQIDLSHESLPLDGAALVDACVSGALLARYRINAYATIDVEVPAIQSDEFHLDIVVKEASDHLQAALGTARHAAEIQRGIMALVDAPANRKRPQRLADWATKAGERYGFSVEVFQKDRLEREGFHGLLSVNRGSEDAAVFILLQYEGPNARGPKFGLVGKGVTFDTGGLSIKPSTNMHYMKSDMGGAAAVLGTVAYAAARQLPISLVAAVPVTDNSVDSLSIKPSDVIESYSGKRIEVIDTDAEGRLILADGLAYLIKHHQPEVLVDVATLTGSCIRALGYVAGGLFSQNDELADQLYRSGQATGERLWRLPLWDDYADWIKSDVADVKNYSGKPMAGATTAGKFLEHFTDGHPRWAHLDVAGMAVSDSPYSRQKSATGFGPRLLTDFFERVLADESA